MTTERHSSQTVTRRGLLRQAIEAAGLSSLLATTDSAEPHVADHAPVAPKDKPTDGLPGWFF